MTDTTAIDMEACMKAGTPGENHRKLDQFVGTWKALVKHWSQPGTDPHVSNGVMTNTWVLGDRFLRQDYKDDGGGFEGAGYWGYNNVTRKYEGLWIDSMSTGMMTEAGDCDAAGTVWEMTGEADNPATGRKMQKRTVITVHDPKRHTMEMFFAGDDGSEFKAMVIEYEKQET